MTPRSLKSTVSDRSVSIFRLARVATSSISVTRYARPSGQDERLNAIVMSALHSRPVHFLSNISYPYSRSLSSQILSSSLVNNTLDADFCIEALEEALQRFEAPQIFNTDQGCQFTCSAFTDVLKGHAIAISMDGKGRWVDNVFVERLWRSVKYEDVYLRAYETPTELRAGLARYFGFYNTRRRHSALDRRTPDAVYFDQAHRDLAA